MRYNLPERVLRELSFFAKEHSVTRIVLFGSRARGNNTVQADTPISDELQQEITKDGVTEAATGSPREILQLGYKVGFVNDSAVWLLMLKKRNISVHIYNEEEIDEMIMLIRDSFLPAFASP